MWGGEGKQVTEKGQGGETMEMCFKKGKDMVIGRYRLGLEWGGVKKYFQTFKRALLSL